ncbi:MAG TPA: hypothetical protein VHG91_06965 [Longimicrobium sp.]|nr:hypothetical protein [Longimicrobium sp.]
MKTRRMRVSAVLAAALFAAGCEQPASPIDRGARPQEGAALSRVPEEVGMDGELLRVQRRIPGFGGYYFDAGGDLNVLLTDPAQEPAARALLAGVAASRPRGPGAAGTAAIRVRRADFDFAALEAWRHRLRSVLGTEGVEFLDTDEAANRVTVGVTGEAAAARVRAEAAALGVPPAALRVERVIAGRPAADLHDRFRPVPGGVEVWRSSNSAWKCTLGFNVWYSNYKLGIPVGTRAFLTASHCTTNEFRFDGGQFVQGGTVIGREIVDPRLFDSTTTARCPAGRRCRWSDVAVVQYDDSVAWELGYIARPQWSTNGPSTDYTIVLHPYTPRLKITGRAYPATGAYVHKIGRTTGWTWGPVLRTCVDYPWSDTHPATTAIMLCQTEVAATALGGDSGSPAFVQVNEHEVAVAGIVWRQAQSATGERRFVFSPLEEMRKDIVSFSPY